MGDYGQDDTKSAGTSAPSVDWGSYATKNTKKNAVNKTPRLMIPDAPMQTPVAMLGGIEDDGWGGTSKPSSSTPAYDPGQINMNGGLAPGQRLGEKTYNAGPRTMGSVNWGSVAGIQNFLQNTGQRGVDYLKSLGIMPSYGGTPIDEMNRGADIAGLRTLSPSVSSGTFGGMAGAANQTAQHQQDVALNAANFQHVNTDGNGQAMVQQLQPAYTDRLGNYHAAVMGDSTGKAFTGSSNGQSYANGAALPVGTGAAGAMSAMNGAAGAGGDVNGSDYGAGDAYSKIIAAGGGALTPEQAQALRHHTTGAVARGTDDALESARIDAIRRGDTSGSSLGSREDQIRRAGAADVASAGLNFDTGLRRENMGNLLAASGGASGLYGTNLNNLAKLREYEIMLAQAQAANDPMALGLKSAMGGKS